MDIKPVSNSDRNLNGIDYFLFWAGVAISLAEIWAGGFLAPLGFILGVTAIIFGHVIGNTFLGLGGIIGSRHGLTSMTTVKPSFGLKGAGLASVLNVIQLVGWAAILLIIAGQAGSELGKYLGGIFVYPRFWILVIGFTTFIWAFYTDMKLWKYLQYITCTMLLVIAAVMTVIVLLKFNSTDAVTIKKDVNLHFMTALDLVIAMPISFLPIVADYSRFARNGKSAFWNTWLGYFIVSSWMYILGLTVTIFTGTTDPALMILKSLSCIGLAVPALILVIFSTVTSNFPDLYSATCSVMNISNKANPKITIWIIAVFTIAAALVFPMAQYENYLLFIGAMFIPLFGIVLTDYFILRKGKLKTDDLYIYGTGKFWYTGGFNITAITSWLIGFILYEYITILNFSFGGSLPAFFAAGAVYFIITKFSGILKN
ncbi:MAG: putative hydroxymethylpyrimidine transporter CytX [Victivallales bacterium]|nr:putative hydroxymethylpyrimidine transporter CytX [Victivallales bacterium]